MYITFKVSIFTNSVHSILIGGIARDAITVEIQLYFEKSVLKIPFLQKLHE